jgi:hypothetical protein
LFWRTCASARHERRQAIGVFLVAGHASIAVWKVAPAGVLAGAQLKPPTVAKPDVP